MSTQQMDWRTAAKLALKYAAQGVPAGPVAIGWDEGKGGTAKRPLTRHGHDDFTTERETVARQFSAARHRMRDGEVFGVGLRPGPAGLVVIDVDVKGSADGSAALKALEAEHGALPGHPVVTTASGGRHEFLRKSGYVGNQGLADGIDIRSDAGWIVAPGTVTPWGSWGEPGTPLDLSAVPEWPAWIAGRLQGERPERAENAPPGRWTDVDRTKMRPADLAALEALEALGGHSPVLASDGTIQVTRPGKSDGPSAQISWNAPGITQVFSTEWAGLKAGTYDADELAGIVELHKALDDAGTEVPPQERSIRSQLKEAGYPALVVELAEMEWARAEARKALRNLDAPEPDPPAMVGLSALLDEPDEDEQWRVHGLIPAGGNALLIAQAKSGKTTWINNLVRCLADWSPFLTEDVDGLGDLGMVTPLMEGETVAVVDLELDRRTIRRWLRTQKIVNTDRVLIESLRGRTGVLDLKDPRRRRAWAEHLRSHNVKVLVIDCLGPLLAFYGAEENSNTEVGQILAALEALKREAGVQELILVHHAGHSGERARGASRLRDWPDVEIRLMIEGSEDPRFEPAPDAARYIAARGRDVSLRERKLSFNAITGRLSLAIEGGDRTQAKNAAQREALLERIGKKPGASQRDLCQTNNKLKAVLADLIAEGLVHTAPGPNRAVLHAIADDCETPANCPGTRVIEGQVTSSS
jgi:hypothetical protein